MKKAYLSIGSNLGDRRHNLQQAVDVMENMDAINILGVSSLYETAPYGPVEQDNFYNAVLKIETSLEPFDLMHVTQGIELAAKREKTVHWGPRTLDIDIVWMEDTAMETEELTIPHKEALNRLFVLVPLNDVYHKKDFLGQEIEAHIQEINEKDPSQEVHRVADYWLEGYGLTQDAHDTIEHAAYEILRAVGEDPERPGLKDTPGRVARMYEEVFSGLIEPEFSDYKLFDSDNDNEMVVVRDITFYSMCEHHLLPFYGKAHIAYIPDGKVLGLSKFARLVKNCAARPSVQEDLTNMIGERLTQNVPVKGVAVALEAEHMCMSMRGAKSEEAFTKSYYYSGVFEQEEHKNDFLKAIEGDLR